MSDAMAAKNRYQEPSPETVEQSLAMARATQRPGQTKEQTRLIAQGIQKGIEHYKKQQKAKARTLDKKLKKVSAQSNSRQDRSSENNNVPQQGGLKVIYKQARLPWILLLLTWSGVAAYFILQG